MTNFLLKDTYTSLIEYPVINNTKILNTKKIIKIKYLKYVQTTMSADRKEQLVLPGLGRSGRERIVVSDADHDQS